MKDQGRAVSSSKAAEQVPQPKQAGNETAQSHKVVLTRDKARLFRHWHMP